MNNALPVAIIGAGPAGLAAAAHLLQKGEEPLVFEAGARAGSAILEWGHVRLFSPWRYLIDEASRTLLSDAGWSAPDPQAHPTGREFVEDYLAPLAATPRIHNCLRLDQRVAAVARVGYDLMKTAGRTRAPFELTIVAPDGSESRVLARAVIDVSGTYAQPNPLGGSGIPVAGEHAAANRFFYGIPKVLSVDRERYAGKRVLVAGSGHSAFNALLDLVDLSESEPATSIVWAVRRRGTRLAGLFGGGVSDALPARGELGARVKRLVDSGQLQLLTSFSATRVRSALAGLVIESDVAETPPVDEVIVATGFRPDLSMLTEIWLGLDPATQAPSALAPLIDPNVHSCGTVPPHGYEELKHPEKDFYIAGMKSYGSAPTFLTLTGYEQVRSIACALTGDMEGARAVRLVLPETGVCSSTTLTDRGVACCGGSAAEPSDAACCTSPASTASGCCSDTVPQLIQLTSAASIAGCCG